MSIEHAFNARLLYDSLTFHAVISKIPFNVKVQRNVHFRALTVTEAYTLTLNTVYG